MAHRRATSSSFACCMIWTETKESRPLQKIHSWTLCSLSVSFFEISTHKLISTLSSVLRIWCVSASRLDHLNQNGNACVNPQNSQKADCGHAVSFLDELVPLSISDSVSRSEAPVFRLRQPKQASGRSKRNNEDSGLLEMPIEVGKFGFWRPTRQSIVNSHCFGFCKTFNSVCGWISERFWNNHGNYDLGFPKWSERKDNEMPLNSVFVYQSRVRRTTK